MVSIPFEVYFNIKISNLLNYIIKLLFHETQCYYLSLQDQTLMYEFKSLEISNQKKGKIVIVRGASLLLL
jgi:hypothetical protein